jgi:uncharacterized protein (TIGR02300 family)
MGRPELGTKLTCAGCSERFYDLSRSPAVCPKCGVAQPPPKPSVYSKPSQGWRPRRQPAPAAADADDGNAAAAAEAEETEEAAESDADPDLESDEEAEESEPGSLEGATRTGAD